MKRKCAVILWVLALSILVTALKDVGTLFNRREILLLLLWVFGRVVLLCYAGVLLWEAEDEVTTLRNGKTGLERRIRELSEELNKTRVSTSQQTCSCGRIWRLMDQEFNVRDSGAIICKCVQTSFSVKFLDAFHPVCYFHFTDGPCHFDRVGEYSNVGRQPLLLGRAL